MRERESRHFNDESTSIHITTLTIWHIDGTLTEWNYTIVDESYDTVAIIRKEIFNFTDTYVIDVKDPENALDALMFVLAIDAEKCTRNKRQNY